MGKVRVNAFSISVDGYGAGPDQGLKYPLGRGGEDMHNWFVPTRSFQRQFGREGGTGGIDEDFAARATPILLGSGEPLFAGLDLLALGFTVTEHATSELAMHVVMTKQP